MQLRISWTMAIAATIACALPIPARAEPIAFTFGGTITEVRDNNNFLDGTLSVGDSLLGSYVFESTIPDSRSSYPTLGVYEDAVQAMSGRIGGLTFDLVPDGGGNITVANDFLAPPRMTDGYSTGGHLWLLEHDWWLGLKMVDASATALSSDALPLEPPDLALFDSRTFELHIESEDVWVYGELTSLAPEPGSFLFAVCGCAAMFVRRPHN